MSITVTKTCLEVLRQLGTSFTDVIFKPTERLVHHKAQFRVCNDTGNTITVNLKDGDFKVNFTVNYFLLPIFLEFFRLPFLILVCSCLKTKKTAECPLKKERALLKKWC